MRTQASRNGERHISRAGKTLRQRRDAVLCDLSKSKPGDVFSFADYGWIFGLSPEKTRPILFFCGEVARERLGIFLESVRGYGYRVAEYDHQPALVGRMIDKGKRQIWRGFRASNFIQDELCSPEGKRDALEVRSRLAKLQLALDSQQPKSLG
jgi:hypothetical protein